VQQNCVVALQSHEQPLKKKAALSVIARRQTDFAAQNSEDSIAEEFNEPSVS